MRNINLIAIHCSATPSTMDIGADTIRRWHSDPKPKGRGWSDIGYHYVIRRNGEVELGRPIERAGAHISGHNAHSVGVCMVGGIDTNDRPEDNFTAEQWSSLDRLITKLEERFPGAGVKGHRELDSGKACPSFDVQKWLVAR